MYLVALFRMYRMYFDTEGDGAYMSLLMFFIILGALFESLTSWTFMAPGRYPVALWYLSLAAVEFNRTRVMEGNTAPDENLDNLRVAAEGADS